MCETKTKGNLAEAKILTRLMELGYNVLQPFGDNCRYDLVTEKDGVFQRVQCKYASSNGKTFMVQTHSKTVLIKDGVVKNKKLHYDSTQIDQIIVYVKEIDKCFLFPLAKTPGCGQFQVRLSPPLNKQNKFVRFAYDFEL